MGVVKELSLFVESHSSLTCGSVLKSKVVADISSDYNEINITVAMMTMDDLRQLQVHFVNNLLKISFLLSIISTVQLIQMSE